MNTEQQNLSVTAEILEDIKGNTEWQSKMERQFQLEEEIRSMGIERYWTNVGRANEKEQMTNTQPVRRLMNHAISQIVEGINAFLADAYSGKAGKKHTAAPVLKRIEPEVAALITARTILDGVAKGERFTPLARRIGQQIEDELAFRRFKAAEPTTFKLLVKRCEQLNFGAYDRNRATMYHNMESREIKWDSWPVRDLVLLGGKLIHLMQETTNLITVVTRTVDAKRMEMYVEATEETMQWINKEHSRCEVMTPMYLPTIVPPRPWQTPFDGGYWTKSVRRLSLVKTYSKEYLQELAEHHMPEVYDAVNAIQHTAWAVNNRVLDVAKTLWENKSPMGVIPSADPIDLPTKPEFLEKEIPKEEWTEEQMDIFKRWKRQATDTYAMNAQLKSLRLQFVKTLSVAEMFEQEDEIYFPHQLDFRGRIYAVPMFLQPQGSDLARGLLQFANASAINDEGSRSWLAIHLSNCYGYDKVSLEERVKWVEEHEEEILAVAADPYSNRLWVEADKPWQFLAGCFEWAEFVKEGYGYLSTLPIQMDGSCNGLQNFSAMLRDPIGGKAVNLTPSAKPADIYQTVADVVMKRVEQDAQSEDEEVSRIAQGWIQHGVTRKVCKRPVMTLAYGAKEFGFKTQVMEDTIRPAKYNREKEFPWTGSGWDAAEYMGKLIWECVGEVVVAARQAMDWLQHAARAASKEGLPVRWMTPDSLVVLQAYPKLATTRIDVTFGGGFHRITVATGATRELDNIKQANGIAPNWVHSMDASHMRATVRNCWAAGMRSFSLIHDSYGTHAGNTAVLAEVLRESFVEMYQTPLLESFKKDLELQLPPGKVLDPLPPQGSLDLELVKQSVYFFA